jgi:hypothetical protein
VHPSFFFVLELRWPALRKEKFGNRFSVKSYDLEKKLRASLLVLAVWRSFESQLARL